MLRKTAHYASKYRAPLQEQLSDWQCVHPPSAGPTRRVHKSPPSCAFKSSLRSSDFPSGQCLSGTRRSKAWASLSDNKRSKRYSKVIACRRRRRLSTTPSPSIQPFDQRLARHLAQGRALKVERVADACLRRRPTTFCGSLTANEIFGLTTGSGVLSLRAWSR